MIPSVVVAWPSIDAEAANACASRWKEKGYKTLVLIEYDNTVPSVPNIVLGQAKWSGFAAAANHLCEYSKEDIVVLIGDDMHPDPNHTPEEIAILFQERFPDLYGVMQPTGDKYGSIENCAVSPWIGRTYIEESYSGHGPYWTGYHHYFSDEELQAAAVLQGAFQQRSDLSHYHDHWERRKENRPAHLMEPLRNHSKDSKLFKKRKSQGFPGCERLK